MLLIWLGSKIWGFFGVQGFLFFELLTRLELKINVILQKYQSIN